MKLFVRPYPWSKTNESFEAFYDDIARLIDQMEIPIAEKQV